MVMVCVLGSASSRYLSKVFLPISSSILDRRFAKSLFVTERSHHSISFSSWLKQSKSNSITSNIAKMSKTPPGALTGAEDPFLHMERI